MALHRTHQRRCVAKKRLCSEKSENLSGVSSHTAFTLVELMIAIGILGILTSVVLVAVNPAKQLCDAHNAQRKLTRMSVSSAIMQYMISTGDFPAQNIPSGESNAKQICRQGVITDETCISMDSLLPHYLTALPVDRDEENGNHTGYAVYLDQGLRPTIVALHLGSCGGENSSASSLGTSSTSSSAPRTLVALANGMNSSFVLGQENFNADVALATQSGLSHPRNVKIANQYIFVGDGNNRVLHYDVALGMTNGMNATTVFGQPDFTTSTPATTRSGMKDPRSIAYDPISKNVFVAEATNNRVLVYDGSSGFENGMQAAHVLGQEDFVSAVPATTRNGMNAPVDLFVDGTSHTLFVVDSANNRILIYDLTAGISDGMNASYVLGQNDFSVGSSGTTNATFDAPMGISYDPSLRRLFVADHGNNRVLRFDLSAGITSGMAATYVLGQPDFISNAPSTSQTGFRDPSGVSYDSVQHLLFVADTTNNRVMVFNLSSGMQNGMSASYVLGQNDFTSSNAVTAQNGMSSPAGVSYDIASELLGVADYGNNRILLFGPLTLPPPPPPPSSSSQSSSVSLSSSPPSSQASSSLSSSLSSSQSSSSMSSSQSASSASASSASQSSASASSASSSSSSDSSSSSSIIFGYEGTFSSSSSIIFGYEGTYSSSN